ncbi:flagellar biosynthesis protein FlaG [Campylobacter hyointestinalis]|uniref:Flagellar biosynthesis protein FlaG n=1 Tax=Campylobacter hyointestinalis TaxID=198 RepID=A0A562XD15_CAMHY|nr:FlaG family protein [Campylobacter hyointestinalis]TWO19566.1 flagellar biosynthesis protein FlaG [Campylobacter hyointestinalis]
MEIFKVASQQLDTQISTQNTQNTQNTRAVEHTNNEQNTKNSTQTMDSKSVNETIKKLNEDMQRLETNVRFGYNDKIDAMYVNVTEANSGKTIRKIPTEHAMKMTEYFKEAIGMLFDKKE